MASDQSNSLSCDRSIIFQAQRNNLLCERQNDSCANRSKSSKSNYLKDRLIQFLYIERFLPGKISSHSYQVMLSERSNQIVIPQDTSEGQDVNDIIRSETSVVKYTNLLRQNIFEDESLSLIKDNTFQEENQYGTKMERPRSKGKGVLNYTKRYKPYMYGTEENSNTSQEVKPIRKIAKQPYKILDAPKLKDDFYNSVLDWSSGNQIAIGLDNAVYTWNAVTNEASKLMEVVSPTEVSSISWCGRKEVLGIGDNKGTVKIYDVESSKQIRMFDNHDQRVGTLDWNGSIITSGSRDGSIILSDVRSPRSQVMQFTGHKQEVCGIKWSPSEMMLASGGNDNKVLVSSLKMPEKPLSCFKDHVAAVKALAWSPHVSNTLATGGGTQDKTLKFWNVANNSLVQSVDTGSQICTMKWSTNTDELVTTHGFSLNQIAIWQTEKVKRIATLYGHSFRVLYLAISPDGENIVTGSGDETLRFWKAFPARKKSIHVRNASQLDFNQVEVR